MGLFIYIPHFVLKHPAHDQSWMLRQWWRELLTSRRLEVSRKIKTGMTQRRRTTPTEINTNWATSATIAGRNNILRNLAASTSFTTACCNKSFRYFKFQPINCQDIKFQPINCQDIKFQPIDCQDIKFQPINCQDIKCQPINFQDIKCQPINCQDIKFQPINFQDIKFQPINWYQISANRLSGYQISANQLSGYQSANQLSRYQMSANQLLINWKLLDTRKLLGESLTAI